jgi:hypothetical protein
MYVCMYVCMEMRGDDVKTEDVEHEADDTGSVILGVYVCLCVYTHIYIHACIHTWK